MCAPPAVHNHLNGLASAQIAMLGTPWLKKLLVLQKAILAWLAMLQQQGAV